MSVDSNSNEDARVDIDADANTVDRHFCNDEEIHVSSSEENRQEGNDHPTTSSTSAPNKDRDTVDVEDVGVVDEETLGRDREDDEFLKKSIEKETKNAIAAQLPNGMNSSHMEDPHGISVRKKKLIFFINKGRPLKRGDADLDMIDNNKTHKEDINKTPRAKVRSKRSSMDRGRRVKGG